MGSATRTGEPAPAKAKRPGGASTRFYALFCAAALILIVFEALLNSLPFADAVPDYAEELRKRQLDSYFQMIQLLIALSTAAIGGITGFVLHRDRSASLGPRQLRRVIASWALCAASLYFGYLAYQQVVWMLNHGFFNPYNPRVWLPTRAQFWSFLASVVVFADFVYASLHSARDGGRGSGHEGASPNAGRRAGGAVRPDRDRLDHQRPAYGGVSDGSRPPPRLLSGRCGAGRQDLGRVHAVPSGATAPEREVNLAKLGGYVVELEAQPYPVSVKQGKYACQIPAAVRSGVVRLVLREAKGPALGRCNIAIDAVPALRRTTQTPPSASDVFPLRFREWLKRASGGWLKAIAAPANAPASIVPHDKGKKTAAQSEVSVRLNRGEQVLAVDLLFTGDSTTQKPGASSYTQLLATLGERPLGIEAAQLLAIAEWLRRDSATPNVRLETSGMRMQVVGALAAALAPQVFAEVVAREGIASLRPLFDASVEYQAAPDLFCLDLYKEFNLTDLAALSLKR
jgi:hypothetical protein